MSGTSMYSKIDIVGGRSVWRDNAKTARSTYRVHIKKIKVIPGWNARIFFDDLPELSLDIMENGLQVPLQGDLSPDGSIFYITDGERRFRAIQHILEAFPERKKEFEYVEVFPNDTRTKPVDKLFNMLSSGVQKSMYRPVEIANGLLRIKTDFHLSNDAIGQKLGRSRQWVDDMIKLAKAPEEVKKELNDGNISRTAITVASRTKSKDEMVGIINEKKKGGKKTRVTDVSSKKTDDALPDVNFDKEQNDQEKQINKIAKCLNKMEGIAAGLNKQAQKDFEVQLKIARDQITELKDFYSKKKNKTVPS